MKRTLFIAFLALAAISFISCKSEKEKEAARMEEFYMNYEKIDFIKSKPKNELNNNPISAVTFCADPTAIEYEGRLYVYGSNDHQQYEAVTKAGKNTYEKIKSLVVFSTDDMVNWRHEGKIDVKKAAPWINNSWAPSICSRVEEDGLTHFYLYFANGGAGVGVITATNPLGPWTCPMDGPLIWQNMPGLTDCPVPFDPGVCIDENGVGWLSFGGAVAGGKTQEYPDTSRIVRLGKDMISLDSEIAKIPAPYFFEANELNYINGTYVYTLNTSWVERTDWKYDVPKPTTCSMCYMTSKTPLVEDSWVYQDEYFPNPGSFDMGWGNNHTHFEKFAGKWWIIYHGLPLQAEFGSEGGFRSLCVNELEVDEENVKIKATRGTKKGVEPLKNLNPYEKQAASTLFSAARVSLVNNNAEWGKTPFVKSMENGAWTMVKNADFGSEEKEQTLVITARGEGFIEMKAGLLGSDPVAVVKVTDSGMKTYEVKLNKAVTGVQNVSFIFGEQFMEIQDWYIK
ncbi:MAG: family 43 glycosylhydrolase [Treponema sp.]|nr:family 43 glycosylhydrolase [Treponema sp.]